MRLVEQRRHEVREKVRQTASVLASRKQSYAQREQDAGAAEEGQSSEEDAVHVTPVPVHVAPAPVHVAPAPIIGQPAAPVMGSPAAPPVGKLPAALTGYPTAATGSPTTPRSPEQLPVPRGAGTGLSAPTLASPADDVEWRSRVWVGHLGSWVTDASLRESFGVYGTIHKVFFMESRHPKVGLRAAFVTFATPAEAQGAIAGLHGKLLHEDDSKALVVRVSNPPLDKYGNKGRANSVATPAPATSPNSRAPPKEAAGPAGRAQSAAAAVGAPGEEAWEDLELAQALSLR